MIPRALKRLFHQISIGDQSYRFMFKPGPKDEAVAFDCETTGLDPRRDDIITIAAVKIRGNRILTSERFEAVIRPEARMNAEAIKVHRLREADVEAGKRIEKIMPQFLHFIGGRPLIGYYLEFDVRMIDKYLLGLLGIELPNPLIEVSNLYYERKYGDAPPGATIDLSFAAILKDLDLPMLDQHDAFNDALMTAMIYIKLRDMKERGVRIPRPRQGSAPQTVG
ncbi:Exonuclease RNase T and DNA polymerase III [Methylocella silvestris BL2]|uniref:Exonuclease RNase T and DNA polymerase III n=1 Tax=Methylocella silvestris (strain DSM 15510 / CIP 108128 / LMG 27833 / NCIMB 13906 / BL2) TaxID=395965 RepID=B8EQ54_METSB|nr:3'-5' exonuclease [Methylocella silvestris]ACK51544.1 Exonuclease RNase T and DNA polymerase III [Methylocella silvestris BL2]